MSMKYVKWQSRQFAISAFQTKGHSVHSYEQYTGDIRYRRFRIHCSLLCMSSHDTELTNDVMFIHSTARAADPCSGSHTLKPGERRIIASLLYLCKPLWKWDRPLVMVTDQNDCHTPAFPPRPLFMFSAVPHFSNSEIQTSRKKQSSSTNNGRNYENRLSLNCKLYQ